MTAYKNHMWIVADNIILTFEMNDKVKTPQGALQAIGRAVKAWIRDMRLFERTTFTTANLADYLDPTLVRYLEAEGLKNFDLFDVDDSTTINSHTNLLA